jgi:hypothetical protein
MKKTKVTIRAIEKRLIPPRTTVCLLSIPIPSIHLFDGGLDFLNFRPSDFRGDSCSRVRIVVLLKQFHN